MKRIATVAAAAALALGGCEGGDSGEENDEKPLRVAAASSLKAAFTQYAQEFPDLEVSLSFAGSDQLAAQIRQGARPDVFAAANVELPRKLAAEGLVEEPVVFAGNRLVLAVPADSAKITTPADLERPGVRIAIASEGVPAGDYARAVLTKRAARNVRSEEPDVAGVVGKVSQGAVDAGFVYATDVRATNGRLKQIVLPGAPRVQYAAAVVKPSEAARQFVAGLKDAQALEAAGFAPP